MTKRMRTLAELDTSNLHLSLDCIVALVDISATACSAAGCEGQPHEQRVRLADRSQLRRTPGTREHPPSHLLLSGAKPENEDSRGTSACEYPAPKTNMSVHRITAGDSNDSQLKPMLQCPPELGDVGGLDLEVLGKI
jgi:hypothetical protein